MLENIINVIESYYPKTFLISKSNKNELTITLDKKYLLEFCVFLKENDKLKFNQLVDLCGVDYLYYKKSAWITDKATSEGFSRAHNVILSNNDYIEKRFVVVYHLLSYEFNHRLRLKVWVNINDLIVPSVSLIWSTANWHEREAFDLFGIKFEGHPNLERILTDYGFEDYPLRKDFPVTGKNEVRYDPSQGKIVYEPTSVDIINTPKVIRNDFRYK